MSIDINIPMARNANEQMPIIARNVSSVRDNVLRLTSQIDSRVLGRSNLRARLQNMQNEISSLENDLALLHRITVQNINAYEENERLNSSNVQGLSTSL